MQRTDRKSNILVTFGIIRAVLFQPRGLLIYGTARPPLYDSLMKKNGELLIRRWKPSQEFHVENNKGKAKAHEKTSVDHTGDKWIRIRRTPF